MRDKTNPKDKLGLKKVQLGLMPAAGVIQGALAMTNGAQKYGPYNWRSRHVRMSIYLDAIERHVMALRDGEDIAADSGVHHIGHIIACGGILADAIAGQFLVDDRPLPGPAARLIEALTITSPKTKRKARGRSLAEAVSLIEAVKSASGRRRRRAGT